MNIDRLKELSGLTEATANDNTLLVIRKYEICGQDGYEFEILNNKG
jgi:hypothetical protein